MIVLHLLRMSRENRCRTGYEWRDGFATEREVVGDFVREWDTDRCRLGLSCS